MGLFVGIIGQFEGGKEVGKNVFLGGNKGGGRERYSIIEIW